MRREDIFPDGAWHGFVSQDLERHQAVIRERHFFKPRAEVENDPSFQQVIPYVVFRHGDRYFLTHRLRASSERRLRKQAKKEARKQAAAELQGEPSESPPPASADPEAG